MLYALYRHIFIVQIEKLGAIKSSMKGQVEFFKRVYTHASIFTLALRSQFFKLISYTRYGFQILIDNFYSKMLSQYNKLLFWNNKLLTNNSKSLSKDSKLLFEAINFLSYNCNLMYMDINLQSNDSKLLSKGNKLLSK